MVLQPVLSICVPSRNRQIYFQQTILSLVASLRTDVEFVFCDNSDDPSVMNSFMQPLLADPRIRYVPSGEVVRPMVDNWETAMSASSGRWISFIGDDDYVDPELAGLIPRLETAYPGLEAIDWNKLFFTWPYEGKPEHSNPVPMGFEIHEAPKQSLMERAFRWDHARDVLGSGFGIYHGAVSRVLMERIRGLCKDRWFEHPIVDYDNIFKVIMHGKRFVHCRRPMSVMGVCPLSHSASSGNFKEAYKKQADFHKEHKVPMEEMDCYRDYPFKTRMGVTACIAMAHHWFSVEYGHNFTGFEENLAKACALQCERHHDHPEYLRVVEGYRSVFATWKGGRFLRHFKPVYKPQSEDALFAGLLKDSIFMTDGNVIAADPREYYELVAAMITRIPDLVPSALQVRPTAGAAS